MKRIIKNNYKIIMGIVIGIILSVTSVYAVDAYIESNKVTYDNKYTKKDNVQEAIDELYERSGIHQEKWVDPVLNGADPVLKDPLIPVEIEPNGDVYYANEKSEWYNYSEKRWANAVILIDEPSNPNYGVGDHILESDIESYFVWIPRYQYKVWDMGNYSVSYTPAQITNTQDEDTSFWKAKGNNTIIIDIKFGSADKIAKMSESEAAVGEYYTHPAFTLGTKNLNGFWMGKFETGGSINNIIVKPNVDTWYDETIKTFFNAARGYESTLDSHMMKNTEWGAAAYLSHSPYGIGTEININNVKYKTGYSSAPELNKTRYDISVGDSSTNSKTQPYNTVVGYLASSTGNISGVYDMSGGANEYVAACIENRPSESGFSETELKQYMDLGYIDRYKNGVNVLSYNNRILGDATGELGPFYSYIDAWGETHPSWYGGLAQFVYYNAETSKYLSWFWRGGSYAYASHSSQFAFYSDTGGITTGDSTFRLVLC